MNGKNQLEVTEMNWIFLNFVELEVFRAYSEDPRHAACQSFMRSANHSPSHTVNVF